MLNSQSFGRSLPFLRSCPAITYPRTTPVDPESNRLQGDPLTSGVESRHGDSPLRPGKWVEGRRRPGTTQTLHTSDSTGTGLLREPVFLCLSTTTRTMRDVQLRFYPVPFPHLSHGWCRRCRKLTPVSFLAKQCVSKRLKQSNVTYS